MWGGQVGWHDHALVMAWGLSEKRGWQRQVGVQGTVDEQVMIKVRSEQ